MCSCEKDDDTIMFDEHHRIPGNDESIIDLCRECHIKIHQLIGTDMGGDNLTPLPVGDDKNNQGGDNLDDGGDSGGIKGVTPMSPEPLVKPSLTIKDNIIIKEQELNIWERVKKAYELQETGNQGTLQVYRKYIEPSEFICEKNNGDGITEFMVRCDNREQHDWLEGRFSSTAKRLLMGYYNTPADNIRLRFVFEE